MRTVLLMGLLTGLHACKGDRDDDTAGDTDTDTDTDTTDTSAGLATLVGDDVPAEETAWAYGVFHLELTGDVLTGTVQYSEDRDSGSQSCAGTLSLTGESAMTQPCEDDPCTWSYRFTVAETDITEGECSWPVPDMAFNLSEPDSSGFLAYWKDSEFWGDTYAQLMLLGYTAEDGWGGLHVLEESQDSSYGLESYDAEAGTVDVDAGGSGRPVSLLYSEACDDLSQAGADIVTVAEPLSGEVADEWDAVADIWELTLAAGDTLRVTATPDNSSDDMMVDLLSPDGCLQAAGDDWLSCPDGGTCGSLSHTATQAGVYRIVVTGSWCSADTCPYDLHIVVE